MSEGEREAKTEGVSPFLVSCYFKAWFWVQSHTQERQWKWFALRIQSLKQDVYLPVDLGIYILRCISIEKLDHDKGITIKV